MAGPLPQVGPGRGPAARDASLPAGIQPKCGRQQRQSRSFVDSPSAPGAAVGGSEGSSCAPAAPGSHSDPSVVDTSDTTGCSSSTPIAFMKLFRKPIITMPRTIHSACFGP